MDSEIVLPLGWTRCTLREVTLPVSKIDARNDPGRRIDYIDISSIDNVRHVVEHAKSYRLADAPSRARQLVHAGDVLFATVRPYLRNIARVSAEYDRQIASTGFSVLRAAIGIVPEFLFYKAISDDFVDALTRKQYGVSYPAVKDDDVRDQVLSLPPTTEQRRIVAKIEELFSELDNGVAMLKTAREQLGTYRQAVLKAALSGKLTAEWREERGANIETSEQSLDRIRAERGLQESRQLSVWKAAVHDWGKRGKHGRKPSKPSGRREVEQLSSDELSRLPEIPTSWQYVRLSEISHIGSGMSVSKSRKLDDPIEIPYLSVANVQRGALDLSSVKSMHIERADLPALALKRWDVLFNEGGDRDKLGRGWIWESQVEPCITQNHVFRASPFLCSVEHSKWISHWGNSFGQRYFETQGKQTTNLASINKTVLSKFPIPLPPVIEQVEILRRLDLEASRLSRMDQNITAALRKLDALRQAILKKAFSGGLVPQDPSDEPASVFLDKIRADRPQVTKRSTPRKTGKRRTPKTTV